MRTFFCFLLGVASPAFAQTTALLAPTPPMGWNTWNTFQGNCSEKLVKETADAMDANGLRAAGYVYVVIDDCWAKKERDPDGNLVADPVKFPDGMKALADYLHAKGFKFGIYGCAGSKTCAGYPGGQGHEYQDAKTYAGWGADYVKYDWCNTGTANAPETYRIMAGALRATGRPIVFSLCEWGQSEPWLWAGTVGQLWRTTGYIEPSFGRMKAILDQQVGLEKYAGPGHWNDPDMLEVGNHGLSGPESRAHFSLWCVLAAPLMAGNDIRHMTPEIRDLLTNPEAIAVDQDALGHQGFRFRVDAEHHLEFWVRELSHHEWALCVLNSGTVPQDVPLDWQKFSFLPEQYYHVRDLWSHREVGRAPAKFGATIAPHDVLFLRLQPGY
jgi:alpha-galactosidase